MEPKEVLPTQGTSITHQQMQSEPLSVGVTKAVGGREGKIDKWLCRPWHLQFCHSFPAGDKSGQHLLTLAMEILTFASLAWRCQVVRPEQFLLGVEQSNNST